MIFPADPDLTGTTEGFFLRRVPGNKTNKKTANESKTNIFLKEYWSG